MEDPLFKLALHPGVPFHTQDYFSMYKNNQVTDRIIEVFAWGVCCPVSAWLALRAAASVLFILGWYPAWELIDVI